MPFRVYPRKPRPAGSQELFGGQVTGAPEKRLIAHVDGGARGNPGPAGYGVSIEDEEGRTVARLSKYLGHQTNNVAEYSGLLAALSYAIEHGHKAMEVVSDSELLVRQMKGQYQVKSPALRELYLQAQSMIKRLDWFGVKHVMREQNREADSLANKAMDEGMGKRVAAATPSTSVAERYQPTPVAPATKEVDGIVRNGRVELTGGALPEGRRVKVRVAD